MESIRDLFKRQVISDAIQTAIIKAYQPAIPLYRGQIDDISLKAPQLLDRPILMYEFAYFVEPKDTFITLGV